MWPNEVKTPVIIEKNAGYEKIKIESVSKSKVPSFEVEKLEAKYGAISKEQELFSVEISYKKKYDNLTKEYFTESDAANYYLNKIANDMSSVAIDKALISENSSELKKLSKIKDYHIHAAVASNPNTSVDTLLSLWKSPFIVKGIILNNPNTSVELLMSVIKESKTIGRVMVATENLRRRGLLCQK